MTKMFHVARVPLIGFVNKKKISFERNLCLFPESNPEPC